MHHKAIMDRKYVAKVKLTKKAATERLNLEGNPKKGYKEEKNTVINDYWVLKSKYTATKDNELNFLFPELI